jgi:hypothetical protein
VERGDGYEPNGDGDASLLYLAVPPGDWMGLGILARSHYCSSGESWAVGRADLGPWFVMHLSWSKTEREVPFRETEVNRVGKGKSWNTRSSNNFYTESVR